MNQSREKVFAVVAGGWSTNIGNAFFNLGAQYVLKCSGDNRRVEFVSDQDAYWNMFPMSYRKRPKNSLGYNSYIKPDYIVLQGSLLTDQFPIVWKSSLEELFDKGTRLILLGVGQFDYDNKEVEICRKFLEKFKPHVLVTRDSDTYKNFADLAENSYDGIDNAYFLPDVFQPIAHEMPPYITINFDKGPDPKLSISGELQHETNVEKYFSSFEFREKNWSVQFPPNRKRISDVLGKAYNYIAAPLRLVGSNQQEVDGMKIVRTDHQINPIMLSRIYRGPNSFCGDIPNTYLNLYSQTELTLSDRIHSVLVTLAYGKPAMLFSKSGRARILERIGVQDVLRKPVTLDLAEMERHKKEELDYLKSLDL